MSQNLQSYQEDLQAYQRVKKFLSTQPAQDLIKLLKLRNPDVDPVQEDGLQIWVAPELAELFAQSLNDCRLFDAVRAANKAWRDGL